MLDCSLVSDDTMSIMPFKSASAHICCRFCHDIPRIMPYAHSPHGTNILPYSHLISIGVLNGVMRMSGSIPPGHSGQIDLSTVLYCRESPTTAADLSFSPLWNAATGVSSQLAPTSSVMYYGSEGVHLLTCVALL